MIIIDKSFLRKYFQRNYISNRIFLKEFDACFYEYLSKEDFIFDDMIKELL